MIKPYRLIDLWFDLGFVFYVETYHALCAIARCVVRLRGLSKGHTSPRHLLVGRMSLCWWSNRPCARSWTPRRSSYQRARVSFTLATPFWLISAELWSRSQLPKRDESDEGNHFPVLLGILLQAESSLRLGAKPELRGWRHCTPWHCQCQSQLESPSPLGG